MASPTNLNTEVLAALARLADTLARLKEHEPSPQTDQSGSSAIEQITQDASKLSLDEQSSSRLIITITHYRTQPQSLVEAYTLLQTAAQYIHATSTKYTLVSKIDYQIEGGNLATELRKGAELLATATLAIFSPETGCGPSTKKYVKQFTRGIVASLISLITAFEDGSALIGGKDNQIGPQKTGAVWSACDAFQQLPKGNRNSMRREVMTWIRDCIESIAEFEEMMALGEREDCEGEEEEMMDEEMYTADEKKVVKASVNVMKCSKNVLGLILKACDCIGDVAENVNDTQQQGDGISHNQRSEMLQWINQLHEQARSIGEGVTDFGILLYPPLEQTNASESNDLVQQLNAQLHSLEQCVNCIHEPCMPISNVSMKSFMSEEVVEAVEKLRNGVEARTTEVRNSIQ